MIDGEHRILVVERDASRATEAVRRLAIHFPSAIVDIAHTEQQAESWRENHAGMIFRRGDISTLGDCSIAAVKAQLDTIDEKQDRQTAELGRQSLQLDGLVTDLKKIKDVWYGSTDPVSPVASLPVRIVNLEKSRGWWMHNGIAAIKWALATLLGALGYFVTSAWESVRDAKH